MVNDRSSKNLPIAIDNNFIVVISLGKISRYIIQI